MINLSMTVIRKENYIVTIIRKLYLRFKIKSKGFHAYIMKVVKEKNTTTYT